MVDIIDSITGDQKVVKFLEYELDKDGKLIEKKSGATLVLDTVEGEGVEQAGDANANGTEVLNLSIAAYKMFICTHVAVSSNLSAVLRIGTGALGAMTDYYFIDLQSAGSVEIFDDKIFVIDNSEGATALTLRLYAPQTAKGIATNNSTSHYFDGFVGGYTI